MAFRGTAGRVTRQTYRTWIARRERSGSGQPPRTAHPGAAAGAQPSRCGTSASPVGAANPRALQPLVPPPRSACASAGLPWGRTRRSCPRRAGPHPASRVCGGRAQRGLPSGGGISPSPPPLRRGGPGGTRPGGSTAESAGGAAPRHLLPPSTRRGGARPQPPPPARRGRRLDRSAAPGSGGRGALPSRGLSRPADRSAAKALPPLESTAGPRRRKMPGGR